MEYRVLGALEVSHEGVPVVLRPGASRELLLWLILARGDVLPAEVLRDRMWSDDSAPANPVNALQIQVSHLRKALATAGVQPLETRSGGYALRFAAQDVDLFRFERLVADARQLVARADAESLNVAAEFLSDAASLWRGDPLAELRHSAYVAGEKARIDELWMTVCELRAQVDVALGRNDQALADLIALVERHPLRERLHELLMLAMYRAGRQGEALQVYHRARTLLRDELGIEPGPELAAMERKVLLQDPALTAKQPAGAPVASGPIAATEQRVTGSGATAAADGGGPLPAPSTTLIGRDAEVGHVASVLENHAIVTITGPGGVGKTRLALAVAGGRSGDVWFVDLSHLDDDAEVAPHVANALGVTTRPDVEPVEALAAEAPPEGLLVLDNAEHVVDGVAAVTAGLLPGRPGLHILVTSRRPLRVPHELTYPLAPLELPGADVCVATEAAGFPAVALFLDRIAERSVDVVKDADVLAIAALCRALDGLPLAIELAAAQTDVLSPTAVLHHLSERFDLLVDDSRGASGRARGLRETIDWSVALLTEEQRAFFGRLAVFPAGFDVSAVAATTGLPRGTALRLLMALVRQSMVRRLPGDRFDLLESLRAYATELFDDDPVRGEVVARHAAYYAELARGAERQVRTPEQTRWWSYLRDELPNFRAALQWCFDQGDEQVGARTAASLTWVWIHEGMLEEADRWLGLADGVHGIAPLARADVLIHVAMLSSATGRFEVARLAAADALSLTGTDPVQAGRALSERGMAEWAMGDLDAAALTHDEAIAVLTGAGESWDAAFATLQRARTAIDAGDPRAAELAGRALRAAQHTGDRSLTGVALQQLSLLALLRGDVDEADARAAESLPMLEAVSYREGIIAAVHLLGRVALARGRLSDAYPLLRRTLLDAQRISHTAGVCEALEALASALAGSGDVGRPAALLDLARRTREQNRVPPRPAQAKQVAELQSALERQPGDARVNAYLSLQDAITDLPAGLDDARPLRAGR